MPTRVKKRRRSPLLPALIILVLIGAAFLIWRLACAVFYLFKYGYDFATA